MAAHHPYRPFPSIQRRSMPYEGSLMLGADRSSARRFVRDQRGSSGYPGPTRCCLHLVTRGEGAADATYLLKGPLARTFNEAHAAGA